MSRESRAVQALPVSAAIVLVALLAALGVALASIPALAVADYPVWLALLIPAGVMGATVFLWDTHAGLCFAAFAIAPLGVVQKEIASITLNLPEVLILALFAKELVRFLARGERPASFLPVWGLLLFVLASLLGIATALLRGNDARGIFQDFRQYTEYVVLYLLVVHRVTTRRQMAQILGCFFVGMLLVAVHGILQRYTGWGITANQALSDEIYHEGIRSGSFYGSTPLGAMMVLALGAAAGLGLSSRSWLWKGFLGGGAAICLAAAVFTNTRASWVAIAVGLLFLFANIRKTPFILAVTAVAVIVFTATLGTLVVQRMAKIEVSKREQSLLERVRYYTAAWHIFRAHPILGLGWGCEFSVRDINLNGRYVAPPPRPQTALNRKIVPESTVHSAYLQILVRIGLAGLLPFLLILWPWLRKIIEERGVPDRHERDHDLYVGVTAALLGYLVHAGLENFFQWPVMSQAFWLLLGLSTVMAHQLTARGEFDRSPAPTAEAPG